MKEGSLSAPLRHPIKWEDPAFYDEKALDDELRRVFDICHGCRRCFNLCDSFPRLFDLIDAAETGEVDSVSSDGFQAVVDGCTLCDMCFMAKCPYVPPHVFDVDFPHLMLRHRAVQHQQGKFSRLKAQIAQTDRNGKWGTVLATPLNWATQTENALTRPLMEKSLGLDRHAALPAFSPKTFLKQAQKDPTVINDQAPGFGEKIVLYATCFVNYYKSPTGSAARAVLGYNGVKTEVVYPGCCGMPQLEQGNLPDVAEKARTIAQTLLPWIEKGYTIVPLVPSCTLMLKQEWPLLLPQEASVRQLAQHTQDLSEYLVNLSKKKGLSPGLTPLEGGISLHIACHARAQNIGRKAEELLRLIPETSVTVIERCSGHGGSWGFFKENFDTALKVGRPTAKQALAADSTYVVSECPLALTHLKQGIENLETQDDVPPQHKKFTHPIEVMAYAYGLFPQEGSLHAPAS